MHLARRIVVQVQEFNARRQIYWKPYTPITTGDDKFFKAFRTSARHGIFHKQKLSLQAVLAMYLFYHSQGAENGTTLEVRWLRGFPRTWGASLEHNFYQRGKLCLETDLATATLQGDPIRGPWPGKTSHNKQCQDIQPKPALQSPGPRHCWISDQAHLQPLSSACLKIQSSFSFFHSG